MSVQPPGYNPGESLLQGGTANITPLMGGGGAYIQGNPNESLLDGGNSANITPLKGGRRTRRKKSLRRTSRRKSRRRSRRKNLNHRGGDQPSMQTYKDTVDKTIDIQRKTIESLQPGDSSFFNIIRKVSDTIKTDVPIVKTPTEEDKRNELTLSILKAQGEAVHQEANKQEEEEKKEMEATTVSQPLTMGESVTKAYEDTMKALDNTVLTGGGGEITTGTLEAVTTPLPDLTGSLDNLRKKYRAYMNRMPWYRSRKDSQKEYSAKLLRNQQVCKVEANKTGGVQTADRLAIFLPNTVNTIYVFKPVNGDTVVFNNMIQFINATKGDNIFLFSPPFFVSKGDNTNLLANFLDMKLKNPEKIYILTEHTGTNIGIGCQFTEENESLIHMYEPTYVIYPHKLTMGEESENKMGIVFSAGATNEPLCPKSRISNYYSIGEYLTIRNRVNWLVFPPNNVEDIAILNNFYTYKFLKDPIQEDYKTFTLNTDEQAVTILNYNKFQGSDNATENDILPTKVVSSGTIFYLRTPKDITVNADTQPYADWLNGIFVQSEADYLNALNLRPDILESIFGKDNWKRELADFLHYLTITKCYDDVRALTSAQCNRNSDFVEKVYEYFLLHDERIRSMEDEDNVLALQAAKDLIERALKKERDTGKTLEEAKAKFKAQLDSLWGQASVWGIDLSRDPRDYEKNPYTDKIVEKANNNTWNNEAVTPADSPNEWKFTIITINKRNRSDTSLAHLYIDKIDGEKEGGAIMRLKERCDELNKAYPSWFFIMSAS